MSKKLKLEDLKMPELLRLFGNKKKRPIVNAKLRVHLKKVVNNLIKKSARKEALEILSKTTQERIGEFLYYYYSNSKNISCMVLDSAKDQLVKTKKMKLVSRSGRNESFGLLAPLDR